MQDGEEDTGGHYEPVIKLTEQVEAKTHEEDEDVLFKMSVPHCFARFHAGADEY